jgi:hypothetical protein
MGDNVAKDIKEISFEDCRTAADTGSGRLLVVTRFSKSVIHVANYSEVSQSLSDCTVNSSGMHTAAVSKLTKSNITLKTELHLT